MSMMYSMTPQDQMSATFPSYTVCMSTCTEHHRYKSGLQARLEARRPCLCGKAQQRSERHV